MAVLPDWVIVLSSAEEGRGWVYVALIEDCVDGNGQKVAEGGDDGLVGIEDGLAVVEIRHFVLALSHQSESTLKPVINTKLKSN